MSLHKSEKIKWYQQHDAVGLLIFIVFAGIMSWESVKLEVGTPTEPGPGFLPLIATSLIGFLSTIGLLSKIKNPEQENPVKFKVGSQWQKVPWLTVVSFLYLFFLWNHLGFILSSMLWLLLIFRIGGLQSWTKNFFWTLLIVWASYYIFGKFGGSLLPVGPLGF